MPQVKIKQGSKSAVNNNAGVLNAGTLAITTDTNELFVTHNDGTVHQLCNPVIDTNRIADLAITKPKLSQDTYDWIDNKVDNAGDTMTGNLNMSGNSFENAGFERFTVLPTVFEGDNIVYANKIYTWNGTKYINNENYFAETGASDTAGRWSVSIPGITELYNGLQIKIVLKTSYDSSYNTININGLGQALVWWRVGSRLTSHFPINSILNLTYYSGAGTYSTFTGGWVIDYAYYSDTVSQNNVAQFRPLAGELINYYKLGMLGADDKFYPLTKENGTGTTKTVQTVVFKLNSPIFYCSGANYAINTRLSTLNSMLYNGEVLYTLNQTFPAYTDLYLVGTADIDNNTFVLDNSSFTSWCTDTLPTTDNGKVYIYLGKTYTSGSNMHLFEWHPVYYFKDGALRVYNPDYISPSDIINKLKTVDGTGSGLDADLLDGNHASDFATSAQGDLAVSALQAINKTMVESVLTGDITSHSHTNNDTKNTAGATDTSSKIYLVGSTEQTANPQTYTHDTAYVGTDGNLYSGSSKTITNSDLLTNQIVTPTLNPTWTVRDYEGTVIISPTNPSGEAITGTNIVLEYGFKPSMIVKGKWVTQAGYDNPTSCSGLCGTTLPASNVETAATESINLYNSTTYSSTTFPITTSSYWTISTPKKGITVSGSSLVLPIGNISASARTQVTYQLPVYYGNITTLTITEANVELLTTKTWKNYQANSKSVSPIINSTDSEYWIYAYPAAWGDLSTISNNDGDWMAAFTSSTVSITGAPGLAISYKYYITVNKGAFKGKTINFS